jgi:hypothetical protein
MKVQLSKRIARFGLIGGRPHAAIALASLVVVLTASDVGPRAAEPFSVQQPSIHMPAAARGPSAKKKCVRLTRSRNREALVNTCTECRTVKVQRTRRGNGFPSLRTLTVQKLSRFDLNFRGPGRSRVLSDLPCRGETKATTTAKNAQCVRLVEPRGRKLVLYNQCNSCRAVGVETRALAGSGARQSYTLKANSYIPTPWLKPKASRIIFDRPCG